MLQCNTKAHYKDIDWTVDTEKTTQSVINYFLTDVIAQFEAVHHERKQGIYLCWKVLASSSNS